jgi:hypothetical protein
MKSQYIVSSLVLLTIAPLSDIPTTFANTSPCAHCHSAPMMISVSQPSIANFTLSSQGIGLAKLGMTYQQLKRAIGPSLKLTIHKNFMVDWDAIDISKDSKVQYRILYPAGTTFQERDRVTILQTDNPNYKTEQGIGSGITIKKAESIYGKATLSYNLDNEGREYVRFAKQPPRMFFRVGNANMKNTLGGIYAQTRGGFGETNKYRDDAKIQSVEITCPPNNCPKL